MNGSVPMRLRNIGKASLSMPAVGIPSEVELKAMG
jgi:hypothetical protein